MGDDQVLGSDAPSPRPLPMLLAHRGDHRHYPENTLAAFRAALAVPGCDGLEFDVRVSRDGVPIVLHDATLARVQGRPERAAELTAAELGALEVPTLVAVLATVPPLAFLDVELKEGLGEAFVDVLRSARGSDLANAAVSSFEATALAHVRELAPTWRCWLNSDDLSAETLAVARDLGCAGVAALWTGVDRGGMERARMAGLEVVAWTVRDRATLALVTGLGVASVCVEGAALEG